LDELRRRRNVIVISASVADSKRLQEEFTSIPFKINGVIHSAGVVRDGAMERQTSETFSEVFTPKGDGYHAIDTLLRDNGHHLDHFIVMSSFTVVTGNVGQLNYGVSNAYLDHQMYLRRMEGKPGTTIHWGNWLDTGMAKRVQKTLTNNGFLGLTNEEALKYLRYAITHKPYELTVAKLDWETVLKKRPDIRQDIVIEAPDRTITGVGCYERFGEQLGYELIKSHSLEKDHDHIVLEQETTTEEGEPFLQVNDRGRVSDDYPASNMVTSGNTGVNSAICNVFGLNVFFDSKNDFRESIGLHIEALSSMPSSSPPLRSSKPYVLHAMGKSLAEVGVQLKGLFYEPRRRKCWGKSVMMFTGQGSQYPFM
ncbi:KR domain protein, partial [Teladorsagia circumcincta]